MHLMVPVVRLAPVLTGLTGCYALRTGPCTVFLSWLGPAIGFLWFGPRSRASCACGELCLASGPSEGGRGAMSNSPRRQAHLSSVEALSIYQT